MKKHSRNRGLCIALVTAVLAAGLMLSSCGGDEPINLNPDVTNLLPLAVISISPATAVPNQTMTLDGSASSDPEGAPIASYAWRQISGASVTLKDADKVQSSFVVPDVTTTLVFELVVTDDKNAASDPATVDIPVTATPAPAPQSAVFVSKSLGDDAAARSGSHNEPVATIGRALAIALQKGFASIYVMEGTYDEMIAPHNNILIKGCVTSVDENGVPSFSSSNANTILKAPVGAAQAIMLGSVHDVRVECMTVIGASAATGSVGVSINGSQRIVLDNLALNTPGAAGALCRDIQATNSSAVAIYDSSFVNSGKCGDAIGVLADNIQNLKVIPENDTNAFTMASGGSESYLKAIQVQNSTDVEIRGVAIEGDGNKLSATTIFTGITLEDAQAVAISNNRIVVDAGDRPAGMLFRCTDVPNDADVNSNEISLTGSATSVTGVRILCPQPNGSFDIEQNRITLTPPEGLALVLRGVDVSTLLRPVKLWVVNNAIAMPVATNDQSAKTALYLNKPGTGSSISSLHNTLLITGNSGELHALSSDRIDVTFSTINDIILVYGTNANNAVYSLPSGCGPAFCAKEIKGNLINANVGAKALPLIYYPDMAQFVALSAANECEQVPEPAPCQVKQIDHRGNVLQNNLKPTYFDFASAMLEPNYQSYAKDRGIVGMGISVDIDGKTRSDGKPDIGATEY